MKTSPAQRQLAEALQALKALQDSGKTVFKSSDLTRLQREALLKNGFLRQIIKGWYMPSRPDESSGDTTAWYAVVQDFIKEYCNERFGTKWHASPEYSILLHAGNTLTPNQITIHSPKATNDVIQLPAGCSLFGYRKNDQLPDSRKQVISGIRVMPLSLALIRVSEAFFRNSPRDAQIALHQLDPSELFNDLLEGGHSSIAGRLAGALRAVGREELGDELIRTFRAAGYSVLETNPFSIVIPELQFERAQSPYVLRIRLMWKEMRDTVLAIFPKEPGPPKSIEKFMENIEAIYKNDAYHSLSIEGYRVSDELILRVTNGDWSPEASATDSEAKNAMAARGYWLVHNEVKETIRKIFSGANPGEAYRVDHATWYLRLWEPSVTAGLLRPANLAGYRNNSVYIRNAAHVPPSKEAVREMMPELCDLLKSEGSAAVRGVLGHFIFVYIHPYMDGNGRLGRFLMNAMLASGGFPWTVLNVERRNEYMAALDEASSRGDIAPFANFIYQSMIETSKMSGLKM